MIAYLRKDVDCVKLLVENGADIAAKDCVSNSLMACISGFNSSELS